MAKTRTNAGRKMVKVDTTLVVPKIPPPTELSKESKKYWRRIVASVPNDYFRPSDFVLLSAYVQAYALMIKAQDMIAEEGEVLTDWKTGKCYKNPWTSLQLEAEGKVAVIATKLCLSPSTRKKRDTNNGGLETAAKPTTSLGKLINRE